MVKSRRRGRRPSWRCRQCGLNWFGQDAETGQRNAAEFAGPAGGTAPKVIGDRMTDHARRSPSPGLVAELGDDVGQGPRGGRPDPVDEQPQADRPGLAQLPRREQGTFPPTSCRKDGKPLLSWRVAILPYIEQDALYKQFHLDEPWDSEHNKKLIAEDARDLPQPGARRSAAARRLTWPRPGMIGEAHVGVLGVTFSDITDGTSNTHHAWWKQTTTRRSMWTKPDDLTVDPKDPMKGLFGHYEKACGRVRGRVGAVHRRKVAAGELLGNVHPRRGRSRGW